LPPARRSDQRGADTGPARWATGWNPALNAFAVTFSDRFLAAEIYSEIGAIAVSQIDPNEGKRTTMIDLGFTTVLDTLRAAWKGSDTDEELWQARPLTGSEVSISRSSETPPTGHIEETAMHPSLSYYLAQADLRH
jgi:hypothetical protein